MRQALDASAPETGVLERAQQVVGHGADVTMRTSGRHDHAISDGALVLEIDGNDVLGLVVVETRQDQGLQFRGLDAVLVFEGRFGVGRTFMRMKRGIGAQFQTPWAASG